MKDTQPIFIVSSGRSGTQLMQRLFQEFDCAESHHEYMIHYLKPLSVKYRAGLIGTQEIKAVLQQLHGRSMFYSEKKIWIDSSYLLSWLIIPLVELFPRGKFIHLVRDGRKVTSSFFHKLKDEIYDDRSTAILVNWFNHQNSNPKPPPEKKYWWYIPINNPEEYKKFQTYNQFERICYHWFEVNRAALEGLKKVSFDNQFFVRLEDLVVNKKTLKDLLEFCDLSYNKQLFELIQRPHNVKFPEDYLLTTDQEESFQKITHSMMKKFGYDEAKEYRMKY